MPDYQGLVVDRSAIVSAYGMVEIATRRVGLFLSPVGRDSWRTGHVAVRPERIGKFLVSGGS